MTLSTKAEIEAGRRIQRVKEEVRDDINPYGIVEDYVMSVEGTEDDPAALDCAWQARKAADKVEGAAEPVAHLYTEDGADAMAAVESLAAEAEAEAEAMLADAPTVVCE